MPVTIGIVSGYTASDNRYHLNPMYVEAVEKAGGHAIILPYTLARLSDYAAMCSGVIFTGGNFTIDPQFFDEPFQSPLPLHPHRTTFEMAFLKHVLKVKVPVLGICAGAQLINVVLGGSLFQDLSQSHPQTEPHSGIAAHQAAHTIRVEKGTLLDKICQGRPELGVNSSHVQAINRLGKGLVVNARALDGVIEGIELANYPFCLGTQWHPEFLVNAEEGLLFQHFVQAAQTYAKERMWGEYSAG